MRQNDSRSGSRRDFLATAAVTLAAAAAPSEDVRAQGRVAPGGPAEVVGTEHWTTKRVGADTVKLFLWRKHLKNPSAAPPNRIARRALLAAPSRSR